jgi:hypothetical protein
MMKKKRNSSFLFIFQLTVVLGLFALAHSFLYDHFQVKYTKNELVYSYLFNYLITAVFFLAMIYFKDKRSSQLGFVFLFSSLIKFTLFFIILAPVLRFEGSVKSITFASFFVPYSISLFLEIFYIIRLLNKG